MIASDKGNYQTDEVVDIAGVEFLSYERVRVTAKYVDLNLKQEILLSSWDAFADVKGRISTDWRVIDVNGGGTRIVIEAKGTITGLGSKIEIINAPLAGEALSMNQCGNDPTSTNCDGSSPAGWTGGLVGNANSNYLVGDSISYRAVMSDLNPAATYSFTIKYDTTKSGKNAIDYLTSYNRTVTGSNPCRDSGTANPTAFCSGAPDDTETIPLDDVVTRGRDLTLGTPDDITKAPGVFSLWGGVITGVSGYTYTDSSGTFPNGTSVTRITVTFDPSGTSAVLAWGGHIATDANWGTGNGAQNLPGSPYHTSNGGLVNNLDLTSVTGSQDLSLSANAVGASGTMTIVKQASPPNEFQSFGFSASGGLLPATFSLLDDDADGIVNNIVGTDMNFNPSRTFAGIGTFTFTETTFGAFDLLDIKCMTNAGTPVSMVNLVNRSVTVTVASGDNITCTWENSLTTAATVSVSGRVTDSYGRGLSRASVSVTDGSGNRLTVTTNTFGYYTINEVEAGESYVFDVRRKGYTFPSRLISVNDDLSNVDFTAQ
ncbi:MAG: carboxypeptidase-like regulatory domain-containing protein [Acidobacteriota bacterium]|nr:carboxypeptidase-like regulatory domain-containing protein [Acidobacteriota bacterium]